jgi:predicted phage-related endonuclease
MQLVDFNQGEDRWHAWRREGVTASDATILMGTHPDKTVWRLWAEKVGLLPEEARGGQRPKRS